MGVNNNQALIDGLRDAITFLEATPELPSLGKQRLRLWLWAGDAKGTLKEAARHLGNFTKEFSEHYFELHKRFNASVEIEVAIDRVLVCKKIVTWDCHDDESLLKLVAPEEGNSAQ